MPAVWKSLLQGNSISSAELKVGLPQGRRTPSQSGVFEKLPGRATTRHCPLQMRRRMCRGGGRSSPWIKRPPRECFTEHFKVATYQFEGALARTMEALCTAHPSFADISCVWKWVSRQGLQYARGRTKGVVNRGGGQGVAPQSDRALWLANRGRGVMPLRDYVLCCRGTDWPRCPRKRPLQVAWIRVSDHCVDGRTTSRA